MDSIGPPSARSTSVSQSGCEGRGRGEGGGGGRRRGREEGRKEDNASVSGQVYYVIESECILISYFHSLDCKPQGSFLAIIVCE